MAANNFTTMLHRRSHSITIVLVYAVLEWILILLLLLNSTLSYLIKKFAAYFGLKPPCTWCSRIDLEDENGDDLALIEEDEDQLMSDIHGNFTIEQLKFAVKAQQKALNASYEELEAQRNAAAIAANQTMAMISKLQEDKAAIQMEALQYQRMMEEQSEYDQEALQILNDLMIKREKENQELEKELEIYHKKVSHYEAREKMAMIKRGKEKQSSNELSNDANCEWKYDNVSVPNIVFQHEHSSIIDKSVTEFEEERISILQELEARLLALTGDNGNLHHI